MKTVCALALIVAAQAFAPSSVRPTRGGVSMMAGKIGDKVQFLPAVAISDCKPGKAVGSVVGGLDICIVCDTDGSIYATGNKAPVMGTPMAGGQVRNGQIKDPLTGTAFSLKTGQVVGKWCPNFPFSLLFSGIEPVGLPVFKARAGSGSVSVEVNTNARAQFEQGYWKGILDAQGKADGGYY
jgi:nitrite reductase/ring-hydroxylating ferredoxin subunit